MKRGKLVFKLLFIVLLLLPASLMINMETSAIPEQPEVNFSPLAVADSYENDDTFETATTIALGTSQDRSIYPIADPDFLVFELDSFYETTIKIENSTGDTRMWLYDFNRNQLAFDDDNSVGDLNSTIGFWMLRPGFYFIKIEESGNDAEIDAYSIIITGTLLNDEFEPNDFREDARVITANSSYVLSINPVGDQDFFTFTILEICNATFETDGTPGGDTIMELCEGWDTVIGYNDDGGNGMYSKITATDLNPGTYFLQIFENGDNALVLNYTLHFTLYPSITKDTQAPTISGIYCTETEAGCGAVIIGSTISDSSGISEATLHYRINSESWQDVPNLNVAYPKYYNISVGPFNAGDIITYYLTAKDNSANYNLATNNNSGSYFSYTILHNDYEGPTIENIGHIPISPDDTQSVTINCTIIDENDIFSATLYYRNDSGSWYNTPMTLDTGDVYEATIGPFDYDEFVEYYIEAVDDSTQQNTEINDNGGANYDFTILASDTTSPTITDIDHSPVSPTDIETIVVSCSVTDSSGIQSVSLFYRVNSGSWVEESMTHTIGSTYEVTIGAFDYDDTIEYYIKATDNYVTHNTATNDNGGLYYSFTIGSSDTTGPTITDILHEPTVPNDLETVTISCTVTDSSGIHSVTLYYRINGGSWVGSVMTNTIDNTFTETIGAFTYDNIIEYYITAVDDYVTHNSVTDDNAGAYYSFTIISNDETSPVINNIYQNIENPTDVQAVNISCIVTDASGIHSVTLFYRVEGNDWNYILMNYLQDDYYFVILGPFTQGYFVEYYLQATDDSPNLNQVVDNNDGSYYSYTVQTKPAPPPETITLPPVTTTINVTQNETVTTTLETGIILITTIIVTSIGLTTIIMVYRKRRR